MQKFVTYSENETRKLAQEFGHKFKKGVIALTGDLGAGKTTFVQGFAKGLGIKEKIISAPFVLIRAHTAPNSEGIFYHVDLYRLETKKDLSSLGLEDLWSNPKNIVLIEWAEKAKKLLPENTVWIKFEVIYGNKRKIVI